MAFLGAKLLNLHPVIEILDGKLVATKKYRGKMKKVAVQMLTEYAEKYNLERDCLWFVWVVGFPDAVRQAVEEGKIAASRYESYRTMYEEVKDKKDGFRRAV